MSNCRYRANHTTVTNNMASECCESSAKSHYVICDNVMRCWFYVTRKTGLIEKSFQSPQLGATHFGKLFNIFIDLPNQSDAIRSRRQLLFFVNNRAREVSPHALGTKNGEWHLFGWQFGGESIGGFAVGAERWRCFEVADMQNLTVRDGEWHRGWYKGQKARHTTCIDRMDTVIDQAHAAEVQNI